jgi:hypothetical protein
MTILILQDDPIETNSIVSGDFPSASVAVTESDALAFLDRPPKNRLWFDIIYLGLTVGAKPVIDYDGGMFKPSNFLIWLIENSSKILNRRIRITAKNQALSVAVGAMLRKAGYSVSLVPIGGVYDRGQQGAEA